MFKLRTALLFSPLFVLGISFNAHAVTIGPVQTIMFDDALNGSTRHFFDGNSDGIADVVFSTPDPFGFNTAGPGSNQLFVQEPGLEGGTEFTPDLRVDFIQGAVSGVGFGFATTSETTGVFSVHNQAGETLSAQAFSSTFFNLDTGEPAEAGGGPFFDGVPVLLIDDPDIVDEPRVSGFPEGRIDLPFDGVAAYATIDFNDGFASRYIVDNFTYTSAGGDVLPAFVGATPDFPVLPDPFDPANPQFAFQLSILEDGLGTRFPIFIDPIIAIGYEYTVNSGPNVATILIPSALPNGDADFTVLIDGVEYSITAGTVFDIFAETGIIGGVDTFKILDISTAESLDPLDTLAFNTGLTFVGSGIVNINQTPITFDTDANQVPVPATIWLMLVSLLGFGSLRKSYTA